MTQFAFAQIDSLPSIDSEYESIDDNYLVETKWRYTYTTHAETNTVIHRADKNYDYLLHFKYDYSFVGFLNSEFSSGKWRLAKENTWLYYPFRRVQWWRIPILNQDEMVLEFDEGKSTFRYHYVRVESKDAPFVKDANELPDVLVEDITKSKKEVRKERRLTKKEARKKKKAEKRKKRIMRGYEAPLEPIEISIIGGGFFGGQNPLIKDYMTINTKGSIVREQEDIDGNKNNRKGNITRQELEDIAYYMREKGFFEMEKVYECQSTGCKARADSKPSPIPLRISLQIGSKYHVVQLSIWAPNRENRNWVNHPEELNKMIDGIYRATNMR